MSIPKMCKCSVEVRYDDRAWLVTFTDGSSLLFQSDHDKAAFAVNCGKVRWPVAWDGNPDRLNQRSWRNLDARKITRCPQVYKLHASGHYSNREHYRTIVPGGFSIIKEIDTSKARIYRENGTVEYFNDTAIAQKVWLSMPRGFRAAFRAAGDTRRPIYPEDFVNKCGRAI